MIKAEEPPFLQPSTIPNETETAQLQAGHNHAPTSVPQSTCKNCHKSFRRVSYYIDHVKKNKCKTQGFFCSYCPKMLISKHLKEQHEEKHKKILADRQVGYGLQHVGQAHSCSVYEENFDPGLLLTVEELFVTRKHELTQIIKQNLHEKKIVKFGTVVTGRFEIPGDDSQNINPVQYIKQWRCQ